MIATQNKKEEDILTKVRMMATEQIDTLLSFLNTIVIQEDYKLKAKLEFIETMKEISKNAQQRGLTKDILKEILEVNFSTLLYGKC